MYFSSMIQVHVIKPRLEGEIVWLLLSKQISTVTIIAHRELDKDGRSMIKAKIQYVHVHVCSDNYMYMYMYMYM